MGLNVVYAEALTEAAILKAVRQGRLYLSSGPILELSARLAADREAMTGEVISLPATLVLRYAEIPEGASLRIVSNGQPELELPLGGDGQLAFGVPVEARWCLLELRAPDGTMLAVTNPIFTPAFLSG